MDLSEEKTPLKDVDDIADYLNQIRTNEKLVMDTASRVGDGLLYTRFGAEQLKIFLCRLTGNCPQWDGIKIAFCYRYKQAINRHVLIFPDRRSKASRFCLMHQDYHEHSTIWWLLDSTGKLFQMCLFPDCFCTCQLPLYCVN